MAFIWLVLIGLILIALAAAGFAVFAHRKVSKFPVDSVQRKRWNIAFSIAMGIVIALSFVNAAIAAVRIFAILIASF